MSGGHVSSDISIDARVQPVRTVYDTRLSPTPMGKLLARWGVEESGTTGTIKARVQMTGLGNTLHDSLGARSEEHTSELQSLMRTSYAVFCWKKKPVYTPKTQTHVQCTPALTHHQLCPHDY